MTASVLPDAVADWAIRVPDAIAVRDATETVTYGQLLSRADAVARNLLTDGVGPGDVVGVYAGRDCALVVAMLAVLRAGAAYLPLDPRYPEDRIRFLIEDAAVTHCVLAPGLSPEPVRGCRIVDEDAAQAADAATNTDLPTVQDSDLAYVIYTSGSTGRPKGVLIEHGSVRRLFDRVAEWIDWSPGQVWSCFHSAAFDFSVWEVWGALTSGGEVVIVDYADTRDPAAFDNLVRRHQVNMVSLTPSALVRLVPHWTGESGIPPSVRHVILGGEAVQLSEMGALIGAGPTRMWNLYGITETTVHSSVRELRPEDVPAAGTPPKGGSPIGVPLSDLTFVVVDDAGAEVDPGTAGELWIAGAGVARGYLGQPELTRERFVRTAIGGAQNRWYRTGDVVRRVVSLAADSGPAEYEYLGRRDRQVQLRGFRIELGEIEAILAQHEGIASAVVEVGDGVDGAQLMAYLTLTEAMHEDDRSLRAWLAGQLPQHLLPAAIGVVEKMPMTANGKLDRAALTRLPATRLGADASDAETAEGSPTEFVLSEIWAEVLNIDRVDRSDHFFDIGGNSMSALRLVAAATRRCGVRVGIATLYRHPTVAQLASWIDQAKVSKDT